MKKAGARWRLICAMDAAHAPDASIIVRIAMSVMRIFGSVVVNPSSSISIVWTLLVTHSQNPFASLQIVSHAEMSHVSPVMGFPAPPSPSLFAASCARSIAVAEKYASIAARRNRMDFFIVVLFQE